MASVASEPEEDTAMFEAFRHMMAAARSGEADARRESLAFNAFRDAMSAMRGEDEDADEEEEAVSGTAAVARGMPTPVRHAIQARRQSYGASESALSRASTASVSSRRSSAGSASHSPVARQAMHVYFDDAGHVVRAVPLGEQEQYSVSVRRPSFIPRAAMGSPECYEQGAGDGSGYGAGDEEESMLENSAEGEWAEEQFLGMEQDIELQSGAEMQPGLGFAPRSPFHESGWSAARRRSSVGHRHLFFDTSDSSMSMGATGDENDEEEEESQLGTSMTRRRRSITAGRRSSTGAASAAGMTAATADDTQGTVASELDITAEEEEEEADHNDEASGDDLAGSELGSRAAAAIEAAIAAERRAGIGGPRRVSPDGQGDVGLEEADEFRTSGEAAAEDAEEDEMEYADEEEEEEEEEEEGIAIDVMTRITERSIETDDEDTFGLGAASTVGTPARALMHSARRKSVRSGGNNKRRRSSMGAPASNSAIVGIETGAADGAAAGAGYPSAAKKIRLSTGKAAPVPSPAAESALDQDETNWTMDELLAMTGNELRHLAGTIGATQRGTKKALAARLLAFQAEAIQLHPARGKAEDHGPDKV